VDLQNARCNNKNKKIKKIIVKGFKKRCIPNTRKGSADNKLWNDRKKLGMKALIVKADSLLAMTVQKVTLNGKGQRNLKCSIY
jgi:hypothetical protein